MALINPMSRFYDDMIQILKSMTIKYSYRAKQYETFSVRSNAERYLLAYEHKDTFFTYDDYEYNDFIQANHHLDEATITTYMNDLSATPISLQSLMLNNRRKKILKDYVELNDYYRMLNGLPNLDETDLIFYLPKDLCDKYNIPYKMPIHEIEDKLGSYYIRVIQSTGYIDKLIEENKDYPEAEYLSHLGTKRISIANARRGRNFEILYLNEYNIMDTTYKEFLRVYNECRLYFMTTAYIPEYSRFIDNYDNFIAMCIFIMTIQQLSMRALKYATDREFYDTRAIQLLYETYGIPFNTKIDNLTQKQIAQNVNVMVQRKASDKVILDLSSVLGFNGVEIYEYYLMKQRLFDAKGRPLFIKKKTVNKHTGKEEEVYDYENMYKLYFQRVNIVDKDLHASLLDPLNSVNYYDITYYDPFWWEDDSLKKEIWETEYNVVETKYLGLAIPYRLTEMLFESVVQFRMIQDKNIELKDIKVDLPKITDKPCTLPEVIMLMCAMLCRRRHISGMIYTMPSQLVHVMEVLDQDINKTEDYKEVFGFDFDAFKPEVIEETRKILEGFLVEREYVISNGHDVDIRGDGTQDTYSPTHLVRFEENKKALDTFTNYLVTISSEFGVSADMKREAFNKLFEDVENLYHFLSYRISVSHDPKEIYAIRKFYDTAFYTKEISDMFEIDVKNNKEYTYENWLDDHAHHLYEWLSGVKDDELYHYMNHIIVCLSTVLDHVDSLYILNDDLSPLQEVLIQLIDFFRSLTTDMVDLSMIMVIDWRMENIIKLLDHPEHINKIIATPDDLTTLSYADFMKRFTANININDLVNLNSDLSLCGHITLYDYIHLMEELICKKEIFIEDKVETYDTFVSKIKMNLDDNLRLRDSVVIIHENI